jgi:hypothetical protein
MLAQMAHAESGISFDLKNGIGYTWLGERLWGGLSLNGSQRRFVDTQLVLSPRVYANYDICACAPGSFFVGVSYKDDFGTRYDRIIDKHRELALTAGATARLNEKFRLSAWVNALAAHDDLIYDSASDARFFDSSANRRTYFDFGGLMLTYLF